MGAAISPAPPDETQQGDIEPIGPPAGGRNVPAGAETPETDAESLLLPWARRVMCAGAALSIVLEAAYLAVDASRVGARCGPIFAYRLLSIAGLAVFLGLTRTQWFMRHWRAAAAGVCLASLAGEAAVALAHGSTPALFITAMLVMIGAATVFPWRPRWQAIPIAASFATAALCDWVRPLAGGFTAYYWIALMAAAGFSWIATTLGEQYRRALSDRMEALGAAHRRLLADLAEREAIDAERERARRDLHESEAALRKIIEAHPDVMAISRLDGTYLDANTDFGYSGREVVGGNALQLGVWADPRDREEFIRKLRADGVVHNMEAMFRGRGGVYRPHLISGALVESHGERLIVSTARDIGDFKQTRRQLIDAREELWTRVAALQITEERLRAEIAERERAQRSSEDARQRAEKSEAKLRKLLEASNDLIGITRLNDGRYTNLSNAFEATGYTSEELLEASGVGLGLWVNRDEAREFMRMVRSGGVVDGMEFDLRRKDGSIMRHLISARLIEIDDEPYIISISRDITRLKRTERDLIAAREALTVKVAALEESQARLEAEIRERERAMEERARLEKRVAESEAALRRIFETSPDAMAITLVADGALIDFNQEFVRIAGLSREEMLGRRAADLNIWPSRKRMGEYAARVAAAGFVRNMEAELRHRDGSVREYLLSGVLVEMGSQDCIVSMTRDVSAMKRTQNDLLAAREELSEQVAALRASQARLRAEIAERRQAERRVHESERKLRLVFETSLDAILIARLSDGRALDVNTEFSRMAGFTREEALRLSPGEMNLWADRDQLRQCMSELRERGFVRNLEAEFRHRNGSVKPYLFNAVVVEIAGEKCIVGSTRDISALKRTERDITAAREQLSAQVQALSDSQFRLRAEIAERELVQRRLQEREATLRKIFDTSMVCISINRLRDGRFVDANREFASTFGYTRDELIGRTPLELAAWPVAEQHAQFMRALLADGRVTDMEAELRGKDGVVHPLQIAAVVAEIDGEECAVTIAHDITRRKRIETELIDAREAALAASRAKSEFLSSMSHEIRTPMNAILGMADLLWESPLTFEQRRYLDTMRTNGNALLDLINGILDLARVESGRLSLERTLFDIGDLIDKALDTLGVRAHEKRLELAARVMPDVPAYAIGDPLRLRQILINLIGNAIKFTETGEIVLMIETAPPLHPAAGGAGEAGGDGRQWLRFSVADTGIGIPADQLGAIFSSFTQADSSTARKYGGSGLGLSIVKRLVELMGGEIEVASEPDKGSTFSFAIPLEIQRTNSRAPIVAGTPDFQRGRRVLAVDDTAANRMIIGDALRPLGIEVTEADDGERALAEIERARADGRPFDVILLDCRMPGMDGIEVMRRLAGSQLDGSPSAGGEIVLMLTADELNSADARLKQIGLGARTRHLLKPIKKSDLLREIGAALKGEDAAGGAIPQKACNPREKTSADGAIVTESREMRILLADDSPDNRLLMEAYLRNTPYRLDFAENGQVAIERAQTTDYDLILMDIQMPVVDGYTAVQSIRQWERERNRPPTPIIALTASALEEAMRKSIEVGCDAHVSKPVRKKTLLETLDRISRAGRQQAAPNGLSGGNELKKFVVRIDPDLSDLVPGFLANKRNDSRRIMAAADQADFDALGKIGHKIKGEGGSYGLDKISDIGADIERAAKAGDAEAVRRCAGELLSYLDAVEIVYE